MINLPEIDYPQLTYLSLGAGVQSSVLALMAASGEIGPMPRAAVFADTQDESSATYTWLDWLETQLPFPVYRVTSGRLSTESLLIRVSQRSGETYLSHTVPAYTINADGSKGNYRRQCTDKHKLIPLLGEVDRLRGEEGATMWIGLSRDEVHRMRDSQHHGITNRWPLIELGITRQGCLEWMKSRGFPTPPRSACVFCPYRRDEEWRRLKETDPKGWEAALEYESSLQMAAASVPRLESVPFLHDSRIPLAQVDFTSDRSQGDLWNNECQGLCGV